ncbi:MAG TPA: response regulator, partial [Gemmataceae bacterium]|nr:response regulator [Gemmataceae bacterium]
MLVLSRRADEKILFPTIQTSIEVLAIKGGVVRLGIEAPPNVIVLREELQARLADQKLTATKPPEPTAAAQFRELRHLLRNRLNIASIGLEVLQQQLQAGHIADAEVTLARIQDEFQSLLQRLEKEERNPSPRPPQPLFKSKALLVEDNPNECELLATFLRMSGVDVDTAGDGSDALDYLRSHDRPDVVLLDMGLPRCDGATTVREIRRNPAHAGLRIFAVTGRSEDEFDLARGPGGV